MIQAICLKKKIVIRLNSSSYRFKKLSSLQKAHYFSKYTTFASTVCDEPGLLSCSKHSLPWPHEFSRHIFRWVAFFITFHYRYNKFYSRLSYNLRFRTLFWKQNWRTFQALSRTHFPLFKDSIQCKKDGVRYIIGRREKWPEKVGRREKSGRKCREEVENEILGVGRYRWEGNFLGFLYLESWQGRMGGHINPLRSPETPLVR